jgi:hypothetical protein
MPYTRDLNDHYGITVSLDARERSGFIASAIIFRRDTQATVGKTHYGEGRTLPAAERRAFAEARAAVPSKPPADWTGRDV